MDNLYSFKGNIEAYLVRFYDFLPTLVGSLLLLFIGWWLIKFILRFLDKLFIKREYDVALCRFLHSIISVLLKVLLILMIAANLGIETTSFIAVLGAAGLAIGLALQGSLANFAGGVIILILKPFRLGDWIEAQTVSGSVTDISLFYTKLTTGGNQIAIIPNGKLANGNVVNYSALNLRKEFLSYAISYSSDIKKAKDIIMEIMTEQDGILKDPEPQIVIAQLADNSVSLSARYWAKNEDFWNCRWYTNEQVKLRLEAAGVELALQTNLNVFSK